MAGGKLSPRQQMINMMYLVLTALLAMNVSKEILNSFITIDNGQVATRAAFESKLGQQYGNFAALAKESPDKYGEANNKAQNIKKAADEMVRHINMIKAKCIAKTEGLPMDSVIDLKKGATGTLLKSVEDISSKDNYDVNTEIMIGPEPKYPLDTEAEIDPENGVMDMYNFRAVELQKRLEAYASSLQAQIGNADDEAKKINASISTLFNYEYEINADGDTTTWVEQNFYHVPLAASTSLLSKVQSDIRAAESDAIGYMFRDVEKSSYKFTELVSAVIPQSTNVTTGANFEADVFLAAYDGQNVPEIRLGKPGVKFDSIAGKLNGGYDVLEMEGTKGKVKLPAGGTGAQSREGSIVFTPVGGEPVVRGFKLEYNVVAPTLVVSPTKMNVFYKGVDNPVNVSIPGFLDKDVTPSINNGTISPAANGGYTVRVSSGTEAIISASAKLPDGGNKSFEGTKFRVKSVPDPVPQFAGKSTGDVGVKKSELTAAAGCIAKMKDFDFDLKFTVVAFDISMSIGGQFITQKSKNNKVTGDQKAMLKKAKKGQKVFIEGIKAKGPDGTIRNLGSLALKVTG